MKSNSLSWIILALFISLAHSTQGQNKAEELKHCDVIWDHQSENSSQSMPCGGGDIGLNVWVEKGDILIYLSKSGTFDENNAFLKLGRLRINLSPNPLNGKEFKQQLVLKDGSVNIYGDDGKFSVKAKIWVDVFNPVVHVDIKSDEPLITTATYETWRDQDHTVSGRENNENSYKFAAKGNVTTLKDSVDYRGNDVIFYHRNRDTTVFDVTVRQQGMDAVKNEMYNPLKGLTFGGCLFGKNMLVGHIIRGQYINTGYTGYQIISRTKNKFEHLSVALYTAQTNTLNDWREGLQSVIQKEKSTESTAEIKTRKWWNSYWDKSFIYIQPERAFENSVEWQAGRNYQLFRYMLGCNAYGSSPTKFNGGLFTFDPSFTDSTLKFTPDFRNWGGGLMTAQNQRLVYFHMIKSGDWDMMKPQFHFYIDALRNAELRSEVYWNHRGACFTEQIENFGLPNYAEYGSKRPSGYDKGMEYNAWLEYEWDTVFQFCLMILETERYGNYDIHQYLPLIESSLTFYNEHYQYLARQRGSKILDANGNLVLYPGSGGETYKMAYNSTATIAALQTVLKRLLALPANYLNDSTRAKWALMLSRIPPITFREFDGHKTIAPAKLWERINNTETPQLYAVFPYAIYGVQKPDLQTAINTFLYDKDALKFRSYVGWKQDNIFAADLGLTEQAAQLNILKMKDSGRRFPAFWGPGFDWTPDHNWGGSGMIGLQEMLLQTDDKKIFVCPAWPKQWNVHFKLRAPYNTTIEAAVQNGKVNLISVIPAERIKDIQILLK